MPATVRYLARIGQAALAVLMAGALLVQYVPLAGGGHASPHACGQRVCTCPAEAHDCEGDVCPMHAAPSAHQTGTHEAGGHGEGHVVATHEESGAGLTYAGARCSQPEPPATTPRALVLWKTLFVPSARLKTDVSSPASAQSARREVFAPQHVADELFRPPRPRIG